MDENRMKEVIKSIYDGLTDEQKEKAKACENPDDLMKLLDEWGMELPDELVAIISGGYQIVPYQLKSR